MLKKYQAYLFYILTFTTVAVFNPTKALAGSPPKTGTGFNERSFDNLIPLITTNETGTNVLGRVSIVIINVVLLLAGILAVVYLIYSGVLYITAGGDTGKADKGRTGIVNAVIGLVVVAAAYLIVKFVGGLVKGANDVNSEVAPI